MIIPASIFRISGFIKNNELYDTPQEGGLMLCYSENGKPIVLEMKSNKPETTKEDIEAYFENKKKSVIKEKEIISVSSELSYLEDFELELEDAIENFKKENNDRKAVLDFKKKFTLDKASEIVNERRRIKKGTIIKTVIDMNDDLQLSTISFKGVQLNKVRSKCLIFDNGVPTTTGFYYFSQTANSLPITLIPVFRENEPLNFFRVELAKVATLEHFIFLAKHTQRSIKKQIEYNKGIYTSTINYNYEKVKSLPVYKILKEIIEINKIKEQSIEDGEKYIILLDKLIEEFTKNPKLITIIQLGFGFTIGAKDLKAMLKDISNPLINLSKSFVNLNFSKENPDIKKELSDIAKKHIEDILNGNIPCEIMGTYHTPSLKLGEESVSWGFMQNNVQGESLVLSIADTIKLHKKLKESL